MKSSFKRSTVTMMLIASALAVPSFAHAGETDDRAAAARAEARIAEAQADAAREHRQGRAHDLGRQTAQAAGATRHQIAEHAEEVGARLAGSSEQVREEDLEAEMADRAARSERADVGPAARDYVRSATASGGVRTRAVGKHIRAGALTAVEGVVDAGEAVHEVAHEVADDVRDATRGVRRVARNIGRGTVGLAAGFAHGAAIGTRDGAEHTFAGFRADEAGRPAELRPVWQHNDGRGFKNAVRRGVRQVARGAGWAASQAGRVPFGIAGGLIGAANGRRNMVNQGISNGARTMARQNRDQIGRNR